MQCSTRSSQQRVHEIALAHSWSIFVLASPSWPCWSFSTGQSGIHPYHPAIRYVHIPPKIERKGSQSTQAVYFCIAKVSTAVFLHQICLRRAPAYSMAYFARPKWSTWKLLRQIRRIWQKKPLPLRRRFLEELSARRKDNSPHSRPLLTVARTRVRSLAPNLLTSKKLRSARRLMS